MFLLHQVIPIEFGWAETNLHSTMFLLHLWKTLENMFDTEIFTFHYVSITSDVLSKFVFTQEHLHSTMFLLHRCHQHLKASIYIDLHSTMFLLHHLIRLSKPYHM